MIVGIQPDRIGQESYSEKWTEFLIARGVEVRSLNLFAPDALEQARNCDAVMWRWVHNPHEKQSARMILFVLEHYLQKPVFPDTPSAWHYDEKVSQTYLLKAIGAPTPGNWVFWDRKSAEDWAASARYPLVFKLSAGAGSSNVLKIESKDEACALIKRAFVRGIFPYTMNEYAEGAKGTGLAYQAHVALGRWADAARYAILADFPPLHGANWMPEKECIYFQEFLPGNDFDTRVTVIGDRAFGFRRMNRPGDFRASGSGRIDHDPAGVDRRCVEIAFEVSKMGKFQCMAYDFLFRDGKPLVCEISYTFADWAVHACPGHWNSKMEWIAGQMWPEEAQVEDLVSQLSSRKTA